MPTTRPLTTRRLVTLAWTRGVLAGMAILLTSCGIVTGSARSSGRDDYGIRRCPASPTLDLLAPAALQCWFDAPHGRWRTLSVESHYDVLVVHVEARDLRDAEEIARRFLAGRESTFTEILVYVQRESSTASSVIHRVRWTRDGGFETLTFTPSAT